jgi:hypothetical protein
MPSIDTISNIALVPNEYKERISNDHFDTDFYTSTTTPEFHKPLIYVTHPDNREEEVWVPPAQEDISMYSSDDDSDDGNSPCTEKYDDWEDRCYEMDAIVDSYGVDSQDEGETEKTEMRFYRTGWQNRGVYAMNHKTNMLYYVDIPSQGWGTSLTIRNGSSSGDIIAESNRKGPGTPFEITFSDQNQRPFVNDYGQLILKFGCTYSRTHKFTYSGRNFVWKSGFTKKQLRDLDTDEIIAEFYSKPTNIHKDGEMAIFGEYGKDQMWVDVIVATALTCQQREREVRRRAANIGSG